MSSAPLTRLTPEEYLERERKAEYKSEYYQGEVFAMAGASPNHGSVVTNLVASLHGRLKGRGCKVWATDLRLRVSATGLYTYPDVMVVCGPPSLADDRRDTLLNPNLIIEVLSDSTRDYDRGRKFQQYRTLASLLEYVTVEQDGVHVEQWARQPDQRWMLTEVEDTGATLSLASIGVDLPLSEIYEGIEFGG